MDTTTHASPNLSQYDALPICTGEDIRTARMALILQRALRIAEAKIGEPFQAQAMPVLGFLAEQMREHWANAAALPQWRGSAQMPQDPELAERAFERAARAMGDQALTLLDGNPFDLIALTFLWVQSDAKHGRKFDEQFVSLAQKLRKHLGLCWLGQGVSGVDLIWNVEGEPDEPIHDAFMLPADEAGIRAEHLHGQLLPITKYVLFYRPRSQPAQSPMQVVARLNECTSRQVYQYGRLTTLDSIRKTYGSSSLAKTPLEQQVRSVCANLLTVIDKTMERLEQLGVKPADVRQLFPEDRLGVEVNYLKGVVDEAVGELSAVPMPNGTGCEDLGAFCLESPERLRGKIQAALDEEPGVGTDYDWLKPFEEFQVPQHEQLTQVLMAGRGPDGRREPVLIEARVCDLQRMQAGQSFQASETQH